MRKITFRCAVCAILAISTMLSCASCMGTQKAEENTGREITVNTKEELVIVRDSSSEYSVVVPAGDNNAYVAGETLVNKILALTGVTLTLKRDSFPESEKEILIGNTSRAESANASVGLSEGTFALKAVGQKIVIAASRSVELENAVEQFVEDYLSMGTAQLMGVSAGLDTVLTLRETPFIAPEKPNEETIKATIASMNNTVTESLNADVQTSRIYTPSASEGMFYNHHPNFAVFKGKYYAFWSNGPQNEDDIGQRIMMSVSSDFENWDSKPLVDTQKGKLVSPTLTCQGVIVNGDTMTVFYMSWEYTESSLRVDSAGNPLRPTADTGHGDLKTFAITTTDGVTWSEPKIIENGGTCNSNIYKVTGGRLIHPSGLGVRYTDDSTGLTGWKKVALTLSDEASALIADGGIVAEGTLVQTDDGVIYLYYRTNRSYELCTASYDNGKTWTPLYVTSNIDYSSKFAYGRLPDGRYYCVRNIVKNRSVLALFISEDGINYNKMFVISNENYAYMQTGLYKAGGPAYPGIYIDEDYMYVVYTLYKESVSVSRIKLSDIS
ncbi:MAG: exo-alpha-sialidase [Eubacteriales bacterium]